jgi:hypothetical protein
MDYEGHLKLCKDTKWLDRVKMEELHARRGWPHLEMTIVHLIEDKHHQNGVEIEYARQRCDLQSISFHWPLMCRKGHGGV